MAAENRVVNEVFGGGVGVGAGVDEYEVSALARNDGGQSGSRDAFHRAKAKNRDRVDAAIRSGRLRALLKSTVKRIDERAVQVDCDDGLVTIENDAVIISAGGVLPTALLQKIGIHTETKHGTL